MSVVTNMNETEVFQKTREIWLQATGQPALGDSHDFYAAGGDSMSAIRLLVATSKEFEAELDVDRFFITPTFGTLHQLVCEALRSQRSTLLHGRVAG